MWHVPITSGVKFNGQLLPLGVEVSYRHDQFHIEELTVVLARDLLDYFLCNPLTVVWLY